jgi:hypothetical protein
MKLRIAVALFLAGSLMMSCSKEDRYPSGIEHVVVIGVDGLSPDGIRKAKTPVLDSMMAQGSVKWKVRTVLTTASSQNWASMIMGAGPEQHGIISNGWELETHTLPPIVREEDGRFPTIFSWVRKNIPEAEIGTVYNWKGFGRLFQKDAVNYDKTFPTEDSTATDFINYIKAKKPTLGFVHFDHVDHAGHHDGHGTPPYYEAVAKADSLIGEVLKGIKEAGIEDKTLVIVTADHGGLGHGHGGPTPQEAEIAMILSGKGVKKGYEIQQQVYTYDLASTIAFALKQGVPYAWIGRPIKAAFEGFDEPANLYMGHQLIEAPVIYPDRVLYQQAGGLYIDKPALVEIETPAKNGTIHYTLDGSKPTKSSPVYKESFNLEKTTVVSAITFDEKGAESGVTTAYFRVAKSGAGNGLNVSFYPAKALDKLPDYSKLKKGTAWVSPEFTIDRDKIGSLVKEDNPCYALQFSGFIQIDEPGDYIFTTNSDDGSKLYIDNQLVVDNDGDHGVEQKKGAVKLTAGKHAIRIDHFNVQGNYWLDAFYQGPGVPNQLIPADKLFLK